MFEHIDAKNKCVLVLQGRIPFILSIIIIIIFLLNLINFCLLLKLLKIKKSNFTHLSFVDYALFWTTGSNLYYKKCSPPTSFDGFEDFNYVTEV